MKILELFNEYNLSTEMTGGEPADAWTEEDWNTMSREAKAYIVSKDFGWIKRLVDNDKIKKNYKEGLPAITKNGFLLEGETALLMLLAISDTPIDDLISYLK